jgi:4-amino-4-deoxy-L-arabinose transferase
LDLVGSGVTFGIVLLVAYFLVYIGPLPFRPLYLPDETRYAEIPREMLATGDWIVPRLNGLGYFEKPVLGYWLTALSLLCFGENRFAVRLPSALATGLSAMLLVFILCRSRYASSALLGAAIFLTSLQVYILGVLNLLDAVFSLFVTASLVCFYCAYQARGGRARFERVAMFGIACGLGFLTKGFLAFVILVVTIVPFLLWQKCRKEFFTLPWIPLLAVVTIILPWAIMIHLREPNYWRHLISVVHFRRFVSTDINSFHPQPFWILLPYLIGGAVPWTFLAFAAIRGLRKAGWLDPLIRYALCWLLFPFLLLSASKGKLGTYILPCFAPLSLLLSVGLTESMKKQDSGLLRVGAWTSAAVAGIAAVAITAMSFWNLASRPIFAPDERWKWVVGSAALVAWCSISIASARAKNMSMSLGLFAVVPVALMLSAHFIVPKQAVESRIPEAFIERCAVAIDPEDDIYSTNYLAPAVCWVLKRSDMGIVERGGELQYGLNYPDAKHRQIQISDLAKEINDHTRTRGIILMITDRDYSRYQKYLPEATWMDGTDGLVFLKYVGPLEKSRKPCCEICPV